MACTVVQYTHGEVVILKYTSIIMKFIVWIINDIHVEFNDIHWEGCLHITRHWPPIVLRLLCADIPPNEYH